MPSIGIRQFIITLSSSQRTHTHQLPTPYRALTSRLACQPSAPPRLRGNSSSLPDPIRSPQLRKVPNSKDLATPTTQPRHQHVPTETIRGGQRQTRSPTPRHQTLSGPPGRRRGSLTRHKLRTAPPRRQIAWSAAVVSVPRWYARADLVCFRRRSGPGRLPGCRSGQPHLGNLRHPRARTPGSSAVRDCRSEIARIGAGGAEIFRDREPTSRRPRPRRRRAPPPAAFRRDTPPCTGPGS